MSSPRLIPGQSALSPRSLKSYSQPVYYDSLPSPSRYWSSSYPLTDTESTLALSNIPRDPNSQELGLLDLENIPLATEADFFSRPSTSSLAVGPALVSTNCASSNAPSSLLPDLVQGQVVPFEIEIPPHSQPPETETTRGAAMQYQPPSASWPPQSSVDSVPQQFPVTFHRDAYARPASPTPETSTSSPPPSSPILSTPCNPLVALHSDRPGTGGSTYRKESLSQFTPALMNPSAYDTTG